MNVGSIAEAVARCFDGIAQAAARAGRDPAEILVVAASKGRTPEEIHAAHAAGIEVFGENRVQEWRAKRDACPGFRWHLIGALQRNKVRAVVGEVEVLEAVPNLAVAEAVSRVAVERGLVQDVLLEVRTSAEPAKHGLDPSDAAAVARDVAALPGVRLTGFLTVADPADPRTCFRLLRRIRDEVATDLPEAADLSMGMSDDLEIAVEEGATIVRPGTALFGPRPPMS